MVLPNPAPQATGPVSTPGPQMGQNMDRWTLAKFRSRRAFHQGMNHLKERPFKRAFKSFYRSLKNKTDIFYMVFPPGLVHWVEQTAGCVPDDVNLVLIAMGLSEQEEAWVRANISRPFHHIPVKVDDQWVWEMLFATNRNNFGWVDVDLFVFNPELFRQMAHLERDVAVNCAWSYTSPSGLDILSTHFLFVNMDAIRESRAKGYQTSPCVHNYQGLPLGRFYPNAYSKIPSKREIQLLRGILPPGPDGLPAYPSATYEKFWFNGFDTMVLFQLVSQGLGFRLNKIRNLSGISATPDHYSDELVHVAALSYYDLFLSHPDPRLKNYYRLILQFDYLVLEHACARHELPPQYKTRRDRIRQQMLQLGLSTQDCAKHIALYLTAQGVHRDLFGHPRWQDLWQGLKILEKT